MLSQTGSLSLLVGPPVNVRDPRITFSLVASTATLHTLVDGGIILTLDDMIYGQDDPFSLIDDR